jgi:hypothetical protein
LREGGSLPGIVEGDDLGTYVCKFRGAGQGPRVLVAEVIVAGLARRIGLRTPDLVALELDPQIARYEADAEVQDLLHASAGLNLGVDFLPGAFGYDGTQSARTQSAGAQSASTRSARTQSANGAEPGTPADIGAKVLWLDAFVANVDRTWRNPNLLVWHGELWLIDHGASLYFHHGWPQAVTRPERFAEQPWSPDDHVLASYLAGVPGADAEIGGLLSTQVFGEVLAEVPSQWLEPVPGAESPEAVREAYVDFLSARFGTRQWLPTADGAGR